MQPGPLSRYRDLEALHVRHATRGDTRGLPVRRAPAPPPAALRLHRLGGYEPLDALARRYLGREELLWRLRDANGGREPHAFAAGELIAIPSLEDATSVRRTG